MGSLMGLRGLMDGHLWALLGFKGHEWALFGCIVRDFT